MSTEFTHSQYAQRRRAEKARKLARWCYQRGIGPGVAEQPQQVLRAVAQGAEVKTPHLDDRGYSPTWQLVADLLGARAGWDRSHNRQPLPHVPCIGCAVLPGACPLHPAATRAVRCRSCASAMDPALAAAGMDLHPSCSEPAAQPPLGAAVAAAPMF